MIILVNIIQVEIEVFVFKLTQMAAFSTCLRLREKTQEGGRTRCIQIHLYWREPQWLPRQHFSLKHIPRKKETFHVQITSFFAECSREIGVLAFHGMFRIPGRGRSCCVSGNFFCAAVRT
jgi:hypothetical protein